MRLVNSPPRMRTSASVPQWVSGLKSRADVRSPPPPAAVADPSPEGPRSPSPPTPARRRVSAGSTPATAGGSGTDAKPKLRSPAWVYGAMWHRGATKLRLQMADTVVLDGGEMEYWLFTDKHGFVKRKNRDKLVATTVSAHLERAAKKMRKLQYGGAGYVAVRRTFAGESTLLTAATLTDLLSSTHSLNVTAALQQFIPSQGGNSTQYRCDYTREGHKTYGSKVAVTKMAFVGTQGPEAKPADSNDGFGAEESPQMLASNFRRLNEELTEATRRLVRCCEENARCRIMACSARFVVDPQGTPWFIGAKNVVTLPRPKPVTETTKPVGWEAPSAVAATASPERRRIGMLSRRTSLVSVYGGDSEADWPPLCEGDYCREPAMPTPRRGAHGAAAVDPATGASWLLPAADASGLPAEGYYTVAYRTVLLDRLLQRRGVSVGEEAPEEALRAFAAEERRQPQVYQREASVCERCACYYKLFARRRLVEERAAKRATKLDATAALRKESSAEAEAEAAVEAMVATAAAAAVAEAAQEATIGARPRLYVVSDGGRSSVGKMGGSHSTGSPATRGMRGSQSMPAFRVERRAQDTQDPARKLNVASRTYDALTVARASKDSHAAPGAPGTPPRARPTGASPSMALRMRQTGPAVAYEAARAARPSVGKLPALGLPDGGKASAVGEEKTLAQPDATASRQSAKEAREREVAERAVREKALKLRLASMYASSDLTCIARERKVPPTGVVARSVEAS